MRTTCLYCSPYECAEGQQAHLLIEHLRELNKYAIKEPALQRILSAAIEEIENLNALSEESVDRELIFEALRLGYNEFNVLVEYTAIPEHIVRLHLTHFISHGEVVEERQGGKPDSAGGPRKMLYFIAYRKPKRDR